MARKSITDETQKNVLTNSRRRCCLCFWLEGKDEVQKGQIAHLDRNNENPAEDNLASLCLVHHDEYDSKTSVTKGLRDDEVRHWRDELYKEMAYRFRTVKRYAFEITMEGFHWNGSHSEADYMIYFRITNCSDTTVRSPVVSIRLPANVDGDALERYESVGEFTVESLPNHYDTVEARRDFFEPNGRVASAETVPPMNPILLPGHSAEFQGLGLLEKDYPFGSDLCFDFRVDAEDMPPFLGQIKGRVPAEIYDFKNVK